MTEQKHTIPVQSLFEAGSTVSSCSEAEPFALQVLGDSMEPEFRHGHIIVVDPEGIVRDGAFVVAEHNNEYIFRQIRIEADGTYLVALQEGHPKIELRTEKAVIGVVIQRAGKRRSEKKWYI